MASKIYMILFIIIYLNYNVIYAQNNANINYLENYEKYLSNKPWHNEKSLIIYRTESNKVKDQSIFLHSCIHKFCIYNSPPEREKRSPKIYPRTTVTLFGRKNRNNNQLEVRRRSVNKRKFQSSHSPGIKQLPPKPNPQIIVKRSIDKDYIEEDKSHLISTTIIAPMKVVEPQISTEKTMDLSNIYEQTTLLTEIEIKQDLTKHIHFDTTPIIEINKELTEYSKNNSKSEKETTDETKKSLNATDDLVVKNDLSFDKNDTIEMLYSTVATSTYSFDELFTSLNNYNTSNVDVTTPKQLDINNTLYDKIERTRQYEKEINGTSGEHLIVNKTDISDNTDVNINTTQAKINEPVMSYQLLKAANNTVNQATTGNTTTVVATSTQSSKDISINQTTTGSETSSTTSEKPAMKSVKRIKQIKPSQEMEKWAKTNLHQLAVISVPYRKCPQGQRIRKGKCVQVY